MDLFELSDAPDEVDVQVASTSNLFCISLNRLRFTLLSFGHAESSAEVPLSALAIFSATAGSISQLSGFCR